jgi:hypothetical protein
VAEINGFSPGLPSAPQTLAQLQTQRALYNPPMTLIGDQTDSVFGEFGLCGGGAGAGIPTFHLEVNNPDLEVHRLVADTSPNCCDGKMHILAFTQEYAGSSYKVYIYVDNTKFGPYDVTGSVHGLGLTSIGGGFNYAQMDGAITLPNGDLVHENPALGINTPNTFAYAANFFAGDISAVVAYNQVLADADVATVTTAFQGAPDGLW